MAMIDITIDSEVMTNELRDYWKDLGILKQHVRIISLDDYYAGYSQLDESDARVKCMIGYKEHPYCINVSMQGGVVKDLFEVEEHPLVRLTLFVFKSEKNRVRYLELSLTKTHEMHLRGMELQSKIKGKL